MNSRKEFMVKLRAILGEALKTFEAVDTIERATFVSVGQRIKIFCLL